jgi:outer membrane protein assembly factor BamB
MSSSRGRGGRGKLVAGVTAAGVMVSIVGVSSMTVAPGFAGTPAAHASGSQAAPGAQLWVSRYDGPAGNVDWAIAVAASPDGSAVFVTGPSREHNGAPDYATVRYDSATGGQLWASRYDGPSTGDSFDVPAAVAVSPDGRTVFVTGQSEGATYGADYATIAYSASTGRELWLRRYNGPSDGYDFAKALVVSQDGKTVYVTGYSGELGPRGSDAYTTIAYNAATGARRWISRLQARANRNNKARAIAISPDGKTLYVTGRGYGSSSYDYLTVAYNAATGAQRWATRYNGPANGNDYANSVVVAPGGKSVYVTGGSPGKTSSTDFATVAYDATTGAQRWSSRYNGTGNFRDSGGSLAITPDGHTLVVAGPSMGPRFAGTGYATVAYNAATGAAAWTRRALGFPSASFLSTQTLAVSPDSSTVYVTGLTAGDCCDYDYGTVAYAIATGTQQWLSSYNGPGTRDFDDEASALALSPDGSTLYVTGRSAGVTSIDFATIAYRA